MPSPVPPGRKTTGTADEQALGRSRGGFSTTIQSTVDGVSNPLHLRQTGGQGHDRSHAAARVEGLRFDRVSADRRYAGQACVELVVRQGAEAVIPPHQSAKQPRDDDHWCYRERHLVECFINTIKH